MLVMPKLQIYYSILFQNTTITNQLEYKKKEIDRLIENEKKLYNTFINSLGENNKFQNILTKIFKKKIKRKKPKVHQGASVNLLLNFFI